MTDFKSSLPQSHLSAALSDADADYSILDKSDPTVDISWLRSFPLFGFSPRNHTNPRYKALSKLKFVMSQHSIEDLRWLDYVRAISLYSATLDRAAKRALRGDQPSPSHSIGSAISVNASQALPNLYTPSVRRPRSTYNPSSRRTLPPDSPRRWSPPPTPPRSPSPSPSNRPQKFPSAIPQFEHNLDDTHFFQSARTHTRRWSLPSDAVPNVSQQDHVEGSHLSAPLVQLLYHMFRHAESIYGLPITVASSPGISLTRLTDRAIISKRTGVKQGDIICSEFATQPFLPAFYVAIDRSMHAIVVCVRGTANIFDWLTDVAATQDPLLVRQYPLQYDSPIMSSSCLSPASSSPTVADDPSYVSGYGHAGVLRSARNLFKRIRAPVKQAMRDNPGFQVVMTGHSLGASTAAVLTLLMRDDDACPHPFCVAFAPPPCLTYDLAEQTATLGVTVVNGPDIVPRLSVPVLLPLFATMRYVADLPRAKKALLSCGIRRGVVDWDKLERDTARRTVEMEKMHDGRRLFIPGRVVQLVSKGETRRWHSAKNVALNRREVDAVRVSRARFLHVRSRQRGMFVGHATFSYRNKLILALRSFGEKPLPVSHAGVILKQLDKTCDGSSVWDEFCRGREPVTGGHSLLESVIDELGS